MPRSLEVIFSLPEAEALEQRDLSETVCVVFDVLRASSTMITALAHGAESILPVDTIADALAVKGQNSEVLLAGEREGNRIGADLTGSIDFDLGNSPREFAGGAIEGARIVMTTTNGTRALRACKGARSVLVGSFLNLSSVVRWIESEVPANLLLVCSGTGAQAAYEDVLAAGALAAAVWEFYEHGTLADSAHIARQVYDQEKEDLLTAMRKSLNGRRLTHKSALAGDISFCLSPNHYKVVAIMDHDGLITKLPEPEADEEMDEEVGEDGEI